MDYTIFYITGNIIPSKSRYNCNFLQFKLQLNVNFLNLIEVAGSITRIPAGVNTHFAFATHAVGESPTRHNIENVIERAFRNIGYQDDLHNHERSDVFNRAWQKVLSLIDGETLTRTYGVIQLDCTAEMYRHYIHPAATEYPPAMIPAVKSWWLEKYEKEVAGDCCICLEDNGGSGCLRLPCSHVFHGHCIKQWLRTSHYCPVCRYQMTTQ